MGRDAKALVFADSSTYSGSDEDPLFDEDNELALMARHLGQKAPYPNTIPDNVQQVLKVHRFCRQVLKVVIDKNPDFFKTWDLVPTRVLN